jgi:uncharacterized protein (DUF1501 family)
MERRVFVRSGALALVTLGLSPRFLRRTAFGMELKAAQRGKTLIVLFQRGAADALNVVVPHGETAYYGLRPSIGIPRPANGVQNAAIDLDGFFGFHPSLAPFKPLYDRGMLAPIHAVGSPSATRSHFDAQDFMESGTPDDKNTPDGWLNRYLATRGTCEACKVNGQPSPFRGVAFAPETPRILEGPSPTVAMNSLAEFSVRATGNDVERLEALYRTGSADLVHASGSEMFEAVKMLKAANVGQYQVANNADYPRSQFGTRLKQIAQLIKMDLGVEIAFADVGGWDTHVNQGGATGQLAGRLDDFAKSIVALTTDLGDRMGDVTIVTMSEFGRTAKENGNGGTDHGHAGTMFVVGGDIAGGKVHGHWPGLAPEQLNEGRDLALTTDFRAVYSEVVSRHLGADRLDVIFPGYAGKTQEWLGVVRRA